MSESSGRGHTATFKAGGQDGSWLVLGSDTQRGLRSEIVVALGFSPDDIDELTTAQLVARGQVAFQSLFGPSARSAPRGRNTRKSNDDAWVDVDTAKANIEAEFPGTERVDDEADAAQAVEAAAKTAEELVIDQINAIDEEDNPDKAMVDLKTVWAKNQELFLPDSEVQAAYNAKGRAIKREMATRQRAAEAATA